LDSFIRNLTSFTIVTAALQIRRQGLMIGQAITPNPGPELRSFRADALIAARLSGSQHVKLRGGLQSDVVTLWQQYAAARN
jgi:hypothetical protein